MEPLTAPPSGILNRKVLVLGFLSTVGDLEVLHEIEAHLAGMGLHYAIAAYSAKVSRGNPDWVDARTVDPQHFGHLIVVCGPFFPALFAKERDLFARFAHCTWIGVNLSMILDVQEFNPFDALLERDSERTIRPDLSFLQLPSKVAVVGLCLASRQPEYGAKQNHALAEAKLRALIARSGVAVVTLDTRWPEARNSQATANASQFESLCARVDVMLTTRLHGTVLALKNGVPVIAVDAIAGGDKLTSQAKRVGWPEIYAADSVSSADLDAALARCLQPEARVRAMDCARQAAADLADFGAEFHRALDVKTRRLPLSQPHQFWLGLMTKAKLINQKLKNKR